MNKPIKPKKPSRKDQAPTAHITVRKFLVYDRKLNKFLLIDHESHPNIFCDPETNVINTDSEPYWVNLENAGYEWNFESLSYNQYQRIYKECWIPSDDFIFCPKYNSDGYYDYSTVEYEIIDPNYTEKLDSFNNRFSVYEKQLKNYELELKRYEEYKKEEKRRKLQEQLNKL